MVDIKIEELDGFFQAPTYATPGSAGADLYAAEDRFVKLGSVEVIPCGFKIELPAGYEAQVRSRSGLATKGLFCANSPGTIDSDYRGPVMVILANFGNTDINESTLDGTIYRFKVGYQVKRGDRIAQMVIVPVTLGKFQLTRVDHSTDRGGGLGSTGR